MSEHPTVSDCVIVNYSNPLFSKGAGIIWVDRVRTNADCRRLIIELSDLQGSEQIWARPTDSSFSLQQPRAEAAEAEAAVHVWICLPPLHQKRYELGLRWSIHQSTNQPSGSTNGCSYAFSGFGATRSSSVTFPMRAANNNFLSHFSLSLSTFVFLRMTVLLSLYCSTTVLPVYILLERKEK